MSGVHDYIHSEQTVKSLQDRMSLLREENANLNRELAALKTPHRCDDCEHFGALKFCNELKIKVYSPASLWLCGHFKEKGTK